jgi:LysM repeat protein
MESGRNPESESFIEAVHNQKRKQREEIKKEIEVKGYMTLREVSGKYNVPADQIKKSIGIPLNTSNNEKLGRLRQQYGFTMSEVMEAIDAERQK